MHVPVPRPRRWVAYAFLALAIVAGVTGTSALSVSGGLTRPGPAAVVGLAYLVCFLAMTRALRAIPIGLVYAIWSGVGIALITLIGWRLFGQSLDTGEVVGIALILAGVVVIHLFSDARAH
ncbi:MAG: multidrug efflux SMR transporter [Burkholderiales bacterium]|nr:MAG: multidrug efflux SMR transporter [Burkholderiales bacterium]